MALNPTLRVIRVNNASLLDEDNLKIIEKMATAHDFQIWIETVNGNSNTGIVIEDGEVKENNNGTN